MDYVYKFYNIIDYICYRYVNLMDCDIKFIYRLYVIYNR